MISASKTVFVKVVFHYVTVIRSLIRLPANGSVSQTPPRRITFRAPRSCLKHDVSPTNAAFHKCPEFEGSNHGASNYIVHI